MNDKLKDDINYCIEDIANEIEAIERDCEEQRYAPIPALLYGQLKAYKRCKGMFEGLLEDDE